MTTEKRHYNIHKNKDGTRRKKPGTLPPRVKSTDSDIPELHGMNGGRKAFYLRAHSAEILDYLQEHGEVETRRHYGINRDDVIKEIEEHWGLNERNKPLSANAKLRLQMNIMEADIKDLKSELHQIKELFFTFREGVGEQLTQKFFIPLLKSAIKLDPKLEEPKDKVNPLDIVHVLEQARNKKQEVRIGRSVYAHGIQP